MTDEKEAYIALDEAVHSLRFYANKDNYRPNHFEYNRCIVEMDNGSMARASLAKLENVFPKITKN